MARLTTRYPADKLARMKALFFPEERRFEFTDQPWDGASFRHYRDPKIECIEHYQPYDRTSAPGVVSKPGRKPAA